MSEKDVLGKSKYVIAKGNTECVEFIRQATGAPQTLIWKKGQRIADAKVGHIARGTAIATFDANGKYPSDLLGRHAAIYLEHNAQRMLVLDQ